MKLTFYGAAKQVTGSNFLLETNGQKFLIDCGLNQGGSFVEKKNFEPFPYNPKEISAVFVTHPHIDHVGRLPKLYKDGFRGKVYSTIPGRDAANLLLLDSEHILIQ
ncbi:MAG: MBL fold metallo-hydrolase, partial [Patescibacteria group bacterium]